MLKEVTQEEFRQEAGKGLVLADFYSTTCGPCKMLAFVLADVDKTCGDKVNIMKIDFDKCKELVEEASGGVITVDVFPNDQLAGGNASKGIEMISDGSVDMAAYATSVLSALAQISLYRKALSLPAVSPAWTFFWMMVPLMGAVMV